MSPRRKIKRHLIFSYKGLLLIVAIVGGLAIILAAQLSNSGQYLTAGHSPTPKPEKDFCEKTADKQYDAELFFDYDAALADANRKVDEANEKRDKNLTPIPHFTFDTLPNPFLARGYALSSIRARKNAYFTAEAFYEDLCQSQNFPLTDDDTRFKLPAPSDAKCEYNSHGYLELNGACQLARLGDDPLFPRECDARVIKPHFNDTDGWDQEKYNGIWRVTATFSADCDCTFNCQRVLPEETFDPPPPNSCDPPVKIEGNLNTSGVQGKILSNSKLRANFLSTKDAALKAAKKELAKCPGINLNNPAGLTCFDKTDPNANQCRNSRKAATAKLIESSVNCVRISIGQIFSNGFWHTTATDCRGQCKVTRECVEEDPFKDPDPSSSPSPDDNDDDISGLGPPIKLEDISGGFGSNFFRSIFSLF